MVNQRDRILVLKNYLESVGIEVNIGKNKARGNKGIFWSRKDKYRVDISKNIPEENVLPTMIHEFAHYLHSTYDNKLKDLSFAFGDYTTEIQEELIKLTVHTIPKEYASSLFKMKDEVNKKIQTYSRIIKKDYPELKLSSPCKDIELNLSAPLKYLLKYNIINYYNKIYSVNNLETDFKTLSESETAYIKLKSEQRNLKRINSRINRINRYYNSETELFARFFEIYCTETDVVKKLAPNTVKAFEQSRIFNEDKRLQKFIEIIFDYYANVPK